MAELRADRAALNWATSGAMIAVMLFELSARSFGSEILQICGWVAMGFVILLAVPRFGAREAYLLTVCAGLCGAIWLHEGFSISLIARALNQATFLMSFILLLSLLYEAAVTSPSVEALGKTLTRQPPGRRYYALNSGTAALSILFNLGVVSFLVPLIQRGIETSTPGDPLNPLRERRQISALLRGFAWMVIWSPTALAPLALMELIPGIDRQRWMLIGFALSLVMMVLGGLEDRLRHRRYVGQAARLTSVFPLRAAAYFAAACGWLLGLSVIMMRLTGDTLVFGLLLSIPVMLIGWLIVQARAKGGAPLTTRLRGIARLSLPLSGPIAVTLATSGFIGQAAAGLIPAQALAQALGLSQMPDVVLLSLIPIVIALLSLLALSPIMMAVFFGALFGALPVLPADPTLLALSISCGWALSMTFSPFSTVVLMVGRAAGIAPLRLTWGWNLLFTLLTLPVLVLAFGFLTGWR
ncbi:MAG: hypothetical protein ACJA2X_000514 [Halocynthiibacter sp.]|jgi:hypothetical protein